MTTWCAGSFQRRGVNITIKSIVNTGTGGDTVANEDTVPLKGTVSAEKTVAREKTVASDDTVLRRDMAVLIVREFEGGLALDARDLTGEKDAVESSFVVTIIKPL